MRLAMLIFAALGLTLAVLVCLERYRRFRDKRALRIRNERMSRFSISPYPGTKDWRR